MKLWWPEAYKYLFEMFLWLYVAPLLFIQMDTVLSVTFLLHSECRELLSLSLSCSTYYVIANEAARLG